MPITAVRARSMHHNLPIRTSLSAWYRYRIGITNISGACSSWADQSGNMRPLLQSTAALRPTVRSDGSLLFDGSNDYLQAAFTLVQPFTVYLAFQQVSWTSTDVILAGYSATIALTQTTSSPGIAASAGTALTVDNTIGIGQNGVASFVGNGASSVYQAAGGAASVITSGNANTNDPGGLTLGASASPGNYSNIVAYELIAYSVAHDAPTRLQIMRYLGRIAQVGGIT